MSLGSFLSIFALSYMAVESLPEISKEEASAFLRRQRRMNSDPSAMDDTLAEEAQPADLERECNEETCDWAEAFEVFGDQDQTDHFMYTRLNKCEILEPCFASGSANCENKWNSYWCQCLSGFYGKDCDVKDTVNGYMCQRPEGCEGFFGAQATTTTSTTTTSTVTLLPPYTPSVECDTINDRFIVRMPKSSLGDYLLGFDMMSATCTHSFEDQQGVVFSYKFTECETRMRYDENQPTKFIYENNLSRAPALTGGVYRDYGEIYLFRCVIDRLGRIDNKFVNETSWEVSSEIMPVYVISDFMVTGMGAIQNAGDFLFRLNVYENSSYLTRYPFQSFPLPKSLNERVFLGAEVITQMEYFYIFTKSCWSAPSVEPNNTVSYPMMYNGCPADSFTFLQPRLHKEDRFETKTLRFPGSNFVYIQCDVIICDLRKANDPACQSTCRLGDLTNPIFSSDRRKRRTSSLDYHPEQIVTLGPFRIEDDEEKENKASKFTFWSTYLSWFVGACATIHFVIHIFRKKLASSLSDSDNTVT